VQAELVGEALSDTLMGALIGRTGKTKDELQKKVCMMTVTIRRGRGGS
jgi:hypothetical protein